MPETPFNQPTSKELANLNSLNSLNQLIYSTLQTVLSNIEFHKGLKELTEVTQNNNQSNPNNPKPPFDSNPALLLTKPKFPKPRELAFSLPKSSRLELEQNQQPQVDFFDTLINPESYIFTLIETNELNQERDVIPTTITNSSDNDNLGNGGNERSGNKSDNIDYDSYVDSDTNRYGGDDKDSILGYDYYGNDPYLGQEDTQSKNFWDYMEEYQNEKNNTINNNPPFKSEADIVDDILNFDNDQAIRDIDNFLDKMFGSHSNGRNADKTTPENQKEGQPKSFEGVKREQQEKRDNEIKEAFRRKEERQIAGEQRMQERQDRINAERYAKQKQQETQQAEQQKKEADNLAKAQQKQVETLKEIQESNLRIADLQRRIDEVNNPTQPETTTSKETTKAETLATPSTQPDSTLSRELQVEQNKLQDLTNQITILENNNTQLLQLITNPNLPPQAVEALVNKIDSNLTKAGELRLEREAVERRIGEMEKGIITELKKITKLFEISGSNLEFNERIIEQIINEANRYQNPNREISSWTTREKLNAKEFLVLAEKWIGSDFKCINQNQQIWRSLSSNNDGTYNQIRLDPQSLDGGHETPKEVADGGNQIRGNKVPHVHIEVIKNNDAIKTCHIEIK
jgi:hypothetical protein